MAINQFPPRYRKGTVPIPAVASGTVVGGTFVKIVDDKDADGNYVMAHCGLGDRAAGVAEYDADAALGSRFAVTPPPSIARVQPGDNITAGEEVQSDANGKAIPLRAAVAAHLDTGVVGNNNALAWTAKDPGADGNTLTVTIVDAGDADTTLAVTVSNGDISVALGTTSAGAGAVTSTAQDVIDLIEADTAANALVSVVNKGASTGAGLMAAVSKTNLAGGSNPSPPGTGHITGVAMQDALSTDRFVEIALVD
jgi:hypothetical protein